MESGGEFTVDGLSIQRRAVVYEKQPVDPGESGQCEEKFISCFFFFNQWTDVSSALRGRDSGPFVGQDRTNLYYCSCQGKWMIALQISDIWFIWHCCHGDCLKAGQFPSMIRWFCISSVVSRANSRVSQ